MATTLSSLIKNNQLPAIAGKAINQNDLVQMGASGKVYPCIVSDYVAKPNRSDVILAPTALTSFFALIPQYYLDPINIQDSLGNNYVLHQTAAGNTGLSFSSFTPAGVLIGTVTLSTVINVSSADIKVLSNNNVLVTWSTTVVNGAKFSIITSVTSSPTLLVNASSMHTTQTGTAYCSAGQSLSGGGFVIAYNTSSSAGIIDLYTNAGVWVSSSASITSLAGNERLALKQLSNGNLLLIQNFNTSPSSYSIWTSALVSVLASTSIPQQVNCWSSLNGFFAFGWMNTSTSYYSVYNNAGVLQGATTSFTCSGSIGSAIQGFMQNDGDDFWFLTPKTAGFTYNRISTAGALITSTDTTNAINGAMCGFDASLKCFISVFITGSITRFFVFDTMTLSIYPQLDQSIIAAGTPGGLTSFYCSDGALFYTSYDTFTQLCYGIFKLINTAIIGVAQSTVAAGSTVQVVVDKGYYQINALKGTTSKSFTMKTVANIYGNNGTISGIAVTQQGM